MKRLAFFAASVAAFVPAVALLQAGVWARQGQAGTIGLRVRETAGIRRTEYPVNARFTIAKAQLKSAEQARLLTNSAEVVAQFTATAAWDDGSVRTLDVDFNASMSPEEVRPYQLQYGDGVTATAKPQRGLTFEEQPDAIQVGVIRFSKRGAPLMPSVTYRGEGIGPGGWRRVPPFGQRIRLPMQSHRSTYLAWPSRTRRYGLPRRPYQP